MLKPNIYYLSIVLLLFTAALNLKPLYAAENPNDGFYAALTLGVGVREANFVGSDGQAGSEITRKQTYEDFIALNLELRYQYKGFFVELPGPTQDAIDGQYAGNALGYNFYNSRHWTIDFYALEASGAASRKFTSFEESRNFSEVRRSDYRLGLRASGYFDNYLMQFIFAPYSFRDEIGGVDASASFRHDWQVKNLNLYASLGFRYRSSEILDHYYGVSTELSDQIADLVEGQGNADISTRFFQPYTPGDGFNIGAIAGFEYPVSQSWVVGGFVAAEKTPNSIKDSPLVAGDSVSTSAVLTISYVF
ncbi:MAG: MipA/OmpV family protein [Aestuariibacter sp.]